MNMETASADQKLYVERNILRGYGEIVNISYVDLEERKEGKSTTLVPVEKKRDYYIGKMSAGQTGGVLAIIGVMFVNGMDYKEALSIKHNLAFLEVLDDHHLTLLVAQILGSSDEYDFVRDNFDLTGWVADVVTAFFKYNDFFGLVEKLTGTVQKMGLTEGKAKSFLAGNSSTQTSSQG